MHSIVYFFLKIIFCTFLIGNSWFQLCRSLIYVQLQSNSTGPRNSKYAWNFSYCTIAEIDFRKGLLFSNIDMDTIRWESAFHLPIILGTLKYFVSITRICKTKKSKLLFIYNV